MELRGRERAVLDGGDEAFSPVLGPRHQWSDGAVVGDEVPGPGGVGVHEVEPLVLDAREQARAGRHLDRVPAHVGHDVGLEPGDQPRPLVAPVGLDAVLDASGEEDLHADADAEHRTPAGEPPADDPLALDRTQPGHARGVRPDTGHDEAVRRERGVEVAGQGDRGAGALDGAHDGAEVARAVVEDDDVCGPGA